MLTDQLSGHVKLFTSYLVVSYYYYYYQVCGLSLDVSVLRLSRDPLRPRPRSLLTHIDKRLSLGIEDLGLGIGLVHIPGMIILIMTIKALLNA